MLYRKKKILRKRGRKCPVKKERGRSTGSPLKIILFCLGLVCELSSAMLGSRWLLSLVFLPCLVSPSSCGSFAASPLCSRSDLAGLADTLMSQCPLSIESALPEEIDGATLDKKLAYIEDSAYISVLFYASWCSFSQNIKPNLDALSSMFPRIWHLTVEESSAIPSVFSRYGIHSFPAILLVNRTARIRYRGSKDLDSLVEFYRKTTGQEPVIYLHVDQTKEKTKVIQPLHRTVGELLRNEIYLAFSLPFVILRALTYYFPKFALKLKAFWMIYAFRHVNLGAITELSQPLGRFLHLIDVKKAWSKLRLSNKTRSFHKGAKSAGVWASSFASVSLGESPSAKSTHLD